MFRPLNPGWNADPIPRQLDRRGTVLLMETNGRPSAWFVLQLPAPDDYPSANKRKGGAKATVSHAAALRHLARSLYKPPFRRGFQVHAHLLPSLLPAVGHRGRAG